MGKGWVSLARAHDLACWYADFHLLPVGQEAAKFAYPTPVIIVKCT